MADEAEEVNHSRDVKPTVSSRRIKSLVEQVTGKSTTIWAVQYGRS
jgi:hypothetical protein